MRRYGLHPKLVAKFRDWIGNRPVEFAAFAWDVLHGSLGLPGDVRDDLRAMARHLDPVLPAPGATFADFRSLSLDALVQPNAEALFPSMSDVVLKSVVLRRSLAGLWRNWKAGHAADLANTTVLASTVDFARRLHLARLSTLATVYCEALWRWYGDRTALRWLVEILLDVGAHQTLALLGQELTADDSHASLVAYLTARLSLSRFESVRLYREFAETDGLLDYSKVTPAQLATKSPESAIVVGDLQLELRRPIIPIQHLVAAMQTDPEWRYAFRVVTTYTCAMSPATDEMPVKLTTKFLDLFGNDFALWYRLTRYCNRKAPYYEGLGQLVAREAWSLPHDYFAWTGLAAWLSPDSPDELIGEIRSSRVEQAAY